MKLHLKIVLLLIAFSGLAVAPKNPILPNEFFSTPANYYSICIMDEGKCYLEDLAEMLLFYNPQMEEAKAYEISAIYVEESMIEGVNHDIAFCQMLLETGFLNFGGTVLAEQNNFCGLGAVNENARGLYFPDVRTGVRAHIQHLKAYASEEELTKECVDDRFKYVKRGSALTVYDLQGKWAVDPEYGNKLEDLLLRLFWLRKLHEDESLSLSFD